MLYFLNSEEDFIKILIFKIWPWRPRPRTKTSVTRVMIFWKNLCFNIYILCLIYAEISKIILLKQIERIWSGSISIWFECNSGVFRTHLKKTLCSEHELLSRVHDLLSRAYDIISQLNMITRAKTYHLLRTTYYLVFMT